ncbi:MAG: DUF1573 domain-containing protein [Planctomycetes bacterium]|nr:DUF1573 domain-containing protein [Planctomycetota bacterium]
MVDSAFQIKDSGAKAIAIERVAVGCSCIEWSAEERDLSPGGSTSINCQFKTGSIEGPFRRRVSVFLEGVERPIATSVSGNAIRSVVLAPALIDLGRVLPGQLVQRAVVLESAEATATTVMSACATAASFTVVEEPSLGKPPTLASYSVKLADDAPTGVFVARVEWSCRFAERWSRCDSIPTNS